jgi:hypothetical protein
VKHVTIPNLKPGFGHDLESSFYNLKVCQVFCVLKFEKSGV